MSESFELGDVEQCTVDAIGEPGSRVFYLQAAGQGQLVTLKLEKQQVAALAHYLRGALDDLPELDPAEHVPAGSLIEPVEAEWVVGSLGVAYDDAAARFVIAADELVDEDDPDPDAGRARISLTRGQVAGFIEQAEAAVEGGRPPCPICGRPMDPSGHVCPRSNGHGVH
ncbi:MAG: DUF3090 family protein [Actinomycetota bacterium]